MSGNFYNFAAIRGVQAGSEYYVIMVPLKMGSLHKSDIIVRFARTNQEPTRHREDHFSEVA